jgi:hypothetical protein
MNLIGKKRKLGEPLVVQTKSPYESLYKTRLVFMLIALCAVIYTIYKLNANVPQP